MCLCSLNLFNQMNRYLKISLILACLYTCMPVQLHSQSADKGESTNIVTSLMDENTHIMIIQPEILTARLTQGAVIRSSWNHDRSERKADPSIRYRIQVYSDNNRQTAKANAERRKAMVEQAIPGMHGYVSYDSPYWRVRMGNFQTEAEAQAAMKQIKSRFPSFESDIRIVRVRAK